MKVVFLFSSFAAMLMSILETIALNPQLFLLFPDSMLVLCIVYILNLLAMTLQPKLIVFFQYQYFFKQ